MKYTHNKIEFCCPRMQDAYGELNSKTICENGGLFIKTENPQSRMVWKFCPFCGERIEQVESNYCDEGSEYENAGSKHHRVPS